MVTVQGVANVEYVIREMEKDQTIANFAKQKSVVGMASQGGSLCNISQNVGRTRPTDESRIKKKHTKSTNHLTNTITMVVGPLAPPVAWI
jgi:hypothetical protein